MKYGALEYAYAAPIADALLNDAAFRDWFVGRTKLADLGPARVLADDMKARRSKAAADWWRSHYSEKCRCDGCRGQETDMLVVLEFDGGERAALHIEVKQPTDVFKTGQGRAYAARAACWIKQPPNAIVPHTKATTLLLCLGSRLQSFGAEPQEFDTLVTFEDIEGRFPGVLPARSLS